MSWGGGVLLVVGVFCAVLFWPAGQPILAGTPAGPDTFRCQVSHITDGDTFRCADGRRVRLHAVAARESDGTCRRGHPCPAAPAAAATAKLTELALGRTLRCEQTGASYNRITAICRDGAGTEINCAMIRSGTAVIWPRFHRERAICRG